jgi:hypothetical protein
MPDGTNREVAPHGFRTGEVLISENLELRRIVGEKFSSLETQARKAGAFCRAKGACR